MALDIIVSREREERYRLKRLVSLYSVARENRVDGFQKCQLHVVINDGRTNYRKIKY